MALRPGADDYRNLYSETGTGTMERNVKSYTNETRVPKQGVTQVPSRGRGSRGLSKKQKATVKAEIMKEVKERETIRDAYDKLGEEKPKAKSTRKTGRNKTPKPKATTKTTPKAKGSPKVSASSTKPTTPKAKPAPKARGGRNKPKAPGTTAKPVGSPKVTSGGPTSQGGKSVERVATQKAAQRRSAAARTRPLTTRATTTPTTTSTPKTPGTSLVRTTSNPISTVKPKTPVKLGMRALGGAAGIVGQQAMTSAYRSGKTMAEVNSWPTVNGRKEAPMPSWLKPWQESIKTADMPSPQPEGGPKTARMPDPSKRPVPKPKVSTPISAPSAPTGKKMKGKVVKSGGGYDYALTGGAGKPKAKAKPKKQSFKEKYGLSADKSYSDYEKLMDYKDGGYVQKKAEGGLMSSMRDMGKKIMDMAYEEAYGVPRNYRGEKKNTPKMGSQNAPKVVSDNQTATPAKKDDARRMLGKGMAAQAAGMIQGRNQSNADNIKKVTGYKTGGIIKVK